MVSYKARLYRRTLYDTIFYKPEDDPRGLKHVALLTFWRRNYFFNFSTPCIYNVNNTGIKYIRIMKQTAF